MPLTSVVLCTYNRCRSLAETLESFARQTAGAEFELLVVDNNSSDETAEVVRSFHGRLSGEVRYLFERKQGKSWALNHGLAKARGDLIAFTDDDVEPEPDWLAQIRRSFDEHRADCVYGKILPRWLAPRPAWLGEYFMHRLALLDRGEQPFVVRSSEDQLFGANFALTREVSDHLGGFNVKLGNQGDRIGGEEDSELFFRLFERRARIVYDPKVVVWHKIQAERMTHDYFRRWHHDHGVSAAAVTHGRGVFGVPFWVAEACAKAGAGYLQSMLARNAQTRMAQEMRLRYYGGLMGQKLKAWRAGAPAASTP